MSFMIRIIIHILANSIAVWTASRFVTGFEFSGNWQELLFAGAILGIANSLVKPIVKLIAFPFILLTLGLFTVIINIALLFLVSNIVPHLVINGFWPALWGLLLITLVNNLILGLTKDNK